ncbi:MAG: hypothetical protein ACKVQU_27710 [Burkholderiales bacterium]
MNIATTVRSNAAHPSTSASLVQHREAPASRYDLYAGIHKGLRAWMSDVLARAGRTDPFDRSEVTDLSANLRALLRFCRKHIESESKYVHFAMEQAIPGTPVAIAGDHLHHERAIASIETELRGLEHAEWSARATAAQRLYRRIALFVADNFVHMHTEETEHNAVLWATYTDHEIAEIEQTIVASHAPEELAEVLRWMVPAMSSPERAAMFTRMRMNAPTGVVDHLLGVVKPYLSDGDWNKLCAATGPFSH